MGYAERTRVLLTIRKPFLGGGGISNKPSRKNIIEKSRRTDKMLREMTN